MILMEKTPSPFSLESIAGSTSITPLTNGKGEGRRYMHGEPLPNPAANAAAGPPQPEREPEEALDDRSEESPDEKARPAGAVKLSAVGLPPPKGNRSFVMGDFRLLRKIGSGGFGAVYLARQISLDRDVALKVLSKQMAAKPDFLQRFYREARTMAKLDHPNIVRGFAVGELQGWHYVAMEYIDGGNMQMWLTRLGRLSVGDALLVTLSCAYALQHAHEKGLVHRDIKPDNLLLTRKGTVKLADLGLAKTLDEDLSLTNTGTGFGTPYYMAPEQARNAKYVDHRCDIYALGGTIYRLVTGQLPFLGDTALELILSKERGIFSPARRLNPEVPEHLDLIIYKMLQKNPQQRYQDCLSLIKDLEGLGLVNESLSFLPLGGDLLDKPLTSIAPEAATQQVMVSVSTPTPPRSAALTDDHSVELWFVRFRTPDGNCVTRKMTTDQLMEEIRKPEFDMSAEACKGMNGDFRPLSRYPELETSVRSRQSQMVKSQADRRAVKLHRMFDELDKEDARRRQVGQPKVVKKEGMSNLLFFILLIVGLIVGGTLLYLLLLLG
jgi:serine/threonine-protein kinase